MRPTRLSSAVCLSLLCQLAWSAPELQGPTPPSPPMRDPAALPAAPRAPLASSETSTDGPRVQIRRLALSGCQAIPCETLLSQLGNLPTEALNLAQIEQLGQAVAQLYKRAGYPFAQVVVPPQQVKDGTLRLQVLEGVLGQATVQGDDPLAQGARPFLAAGLPVGEAIREDRLERTMLLIDDQPGFDLRPVLRPGAAVGEGDLLAQVQRLNHVSGDVGLDNTGNRSTGTHRLKVAVNVNSPFLFGDRIALNALTTDQSMWLGSLDYDRPLGAEGWRGQIGWSRTSYVLGGAFEALGAKGTAETLTLKTSHPVIRSQSANLLASLSLQHKALQDRYDSVNLVRDKSSELLTLSAQFDRRDTWLGGGVVYGQIGLTHGRLHLDSGSRAIDAATARTEGGFGKVNIDIARIQKLFGTWSLYARWSAQWGNGNLDSSEKYGMGGFLGVRAYPMGEGTGDRGWLGQTELRWSLGAFTPFALLDTGHMRTNAQPWDAASRAQRDITGAGLGLRWGEGGWSIEAAVSGRIHGHAAQAEAPDRPVRAWLTLNRRFD
ncbi:ShlB/FhaC/HecB family hemolysin secretion/activation protein [Aquabacterium sp.]|uniref:ShlB/FhaC/HecB family hemolysin secretion/activation protein n=1 Tax=Aquabacterium sp. TaxID=1872578 RepID=UPI0025BE8819|nr:ShlB/FhaC/HecB family hemolysin secretion/activation protein [Aquabacterium sp.]